MKLRTLCLCTLLTLLVFTRCKKQENEGPETPAGADFKEMNVPAGFDYSTTSVQQLNVHVELLGGAPYEGAEFDVVLDDPAEVIDQQEKLAKLATVLSFRLDKNGNYSSEVKFPAYVNKIYLVSKSIGIPEYFELSKSATGFSMVYNPNKAAQKSSKAASFDFSASLRQNGSGGSNAKIMDTGSGGFSSTAVRSWSNVGFPDYLTDPVYVNPSFLSRFKGALPKGVPVPENSAYLNSNVPRTIVLDLLPGQTADVSITFMFANSANRNSLGYYWYPTSTPPATAAAIPSGNKGYIFPSTSRSSLADYSGLVAGHTVKLVGPNADGSFPANTTIGFYLISNSFSVTAVGTPGTINTSRTTYYADNRMNTAGGTGYMAGKKERMVTLYDEATNKIVWSIEDGTDGDYSDIAFFASWNPNEAVDPAPYPKLPTAPRTDSDYIFYPAKDVQGTLLFEDCWPRLADFDMNDMVIHHNYTGLIDQAAPTKVSEVNFTFDLASISARQNNSFGVMVPNVAPGSVALVSNLNFDGNNVNTNQSTKYTLESGHTNDVVIKVFDQASTILGGDAVNNTGENAITRSAVKFSFTVKFNPSISMSDFNKISPFIIPRGNRSVETHLANRRPTTKANTAFFGTEDDNSSSASGRYYLSNTRSSAGNITWAIDVPQKIPYPKTGESMTRAYPNFVSWATSGATSHLDWYTNGVGNRVADKLISADN